MLEIISYFQGDSNLFGYRQDTGSSEGIQRQSKLKSEIQKITYDIGLLFVDIIFSEIVLQRATPLK